MQYRCRVITAVLAVVFAMAPCADGGAEPRILTYDEAVAIALGESYTVRSYQTDLRSMRASFDYYRAQFKPRIDFSLFAPSLRESVSPIERADGLPVYNSTGLMQAGGTLQFTYMLPTGGNVAVSSQMYRENLKTVLALRQYEALRREQAYSSVSLSFSQPIFTANTLKQDLEEAEYSYQRTTHRYTRGQMDIVYDVTKGFFGLYRVVRSAKIAQDRLANSEDAYRIARLKNDAGRLPEGDVLIAEVQMSTDRAALLESEGELARTMEEFKQLIGLPMDEDIAIETDLTYDTFAVDEEKAVAEAVKNRLEIQEAELDIRLQEIDVDRARRLREFKGEITAYYDVTGVSTDTGGSTRSLFASSFDNFVDRPPNRGVSLTFSYPVFDWGRGSSRVEQETATLRGRELALENVRRTVAREARDVVRTVGETRTRLEIHEKNQVIAQKSYDISRMRFENGDITSQELGRELERLAESQLAYLDSFISYQLAVNDLGRATLWDFKNDMISIPDSLIDER